MNLVQVRDNLAINPDRIDYVSYNPNIEDTTYTVCVNTKSFELTAYELSYLINYMNYDNPYAYNSYSNSYELK